MSGSPSNTDGQAPAREDSGAPAPDWKDEIAARVRARSRRDRESAGQPTLPGMEDSFSADAVAARVARRYARLPSWKEALAAQAAEQPPAESPAPPLAPTSNEPPPEQLRIAEVAPVVEPAPEPYQPDLLRYSVSSDSLPPQRLTPPEARPSREAMPEPGFSDPMDDAVVEPALPLPAGLVTTPRELVAPRKARPRRAEGPLRETGTGGFDLARNSTRREATEDTSGEGGPAEIFAGDSERTMSAAKELPPVWHSIHLDAEAPLRERRSSPSAAPDEPLLHVAPLADRAMAALVDCALSLCAFLVFSLVFALSSTHLPHGRIALLGACAILFAMGLLYQLLFFSLTDATPGMRYARIALCTFDDENPSRSALRGRIAAMLLSALPLGLGFLWAVFDEDSLGWHDRITRTYQRSYRDE